MAESKDLKKSIDDLKKEVACGICQKLYQEPKLLPCSHCFCKQCVIQLCHENNGGQIRCPECQAAQAITQDTVGGLKTAYHVNRLVDLQRSLLEAFQKEKAKLPSESEAPSSKCSKHGDFKLLYCYSCKCFICRDCAIFEHRKHNYEYNSTAIPKRKKTLLHSKKLFVNVNKDFQEALQKVRKASETVGAQGNRVTKFVSSYFKQMYDILHEQEATLLEQNQRITSQRLSQLQAQEEDLSSSCDSLSDVVKQVEQHLSSCSCEEVMSADLLELIETQKTDVKTLEKDEESDDSLFGGSLFSPIEKYEKHKLIPSVRAFMEVEAEPLSNFFPYTKELVNFVNVNLNFEKEVVIGNYQKLVQPDQKYSFKFSSETERELEGYISTLPPESHKMRKCDINRTGAISYYVEYVSPIIPGKYHINVLVAGKNVCGSPLILEVVEHDVFVALQKM